MGIELYDVYGTKVASKEETPFPKGNQINIWYDVNGELGYTLTAGAYYEYKFYAVISGNPYYSESFSIREKQNYSLDLNGYLDGTDSSGLNEYGRVNVYINDFLAGEHVSDYYAEWPVGTFYAIRNIHANAGYIYQGVRKR